MSGDFFIPIINDKKTSEFTFLINFAETYLSFGTRCYKFVDVKANGSIVVVESQFSKNRWVYATLKIASMVVTLGIFPLVILIIKSLYRVYHPFKLIKPLSISSLENQPREILHKMFIDYFSCSELFQYTILNKKFNEMIDNDFTRWENIYREITEGVSNKALDLFVERVKLLYTQGKEPSFKQKVKYFCQELWEEAKQIPKIQELIKNEKLTIGCLLNKKQFDHLKEIIRPIKDENLILMVETTELSSLLDGKILEVVNKNEKADLIRNWFDLDVNRQKLTKITELDLTEPDSIKLLSTEMLAYMTYMPNLQTLNLQENDLCLLPMAIGALVQLQALELRYNKLSFLPHTIGNLKQLRTLELADNQLSSLPDTLGSLSQLRELNLCDNQLSLLPNTIGNLKQLQSIDISRNQLSILPNVIGNLNYLKKLHLYNNQLSSLPDSIGNLDQLQSLNVDSNQLSTLPSVIGNLNQLQRLSLDCNRFSSLPNTIGNLKQLKYLNLVGNKFSSLPNTIKDLDQLEVTIEKKMNFQLVD